MQNTPFEILTFFMGILMFLLFLIYKIKSSMVKGKQGKLLRRQLQTFVDKGYTELQDEKGRDILFMAATSGFEDVVTAAIKKGADPNRLYKGYPLLRILAKSYPFETGTAKALLAGGALPDGPAGFEVTPLWLCASLDHSDMAKVLIDRGADVNFICPTSGMTILMTAVYKQSVEIGRLLLSAGANVHILDKHGQNALDFAYKQGGGPMHHTGGADSAGPEDTHPHAFRELLRQIQCAMEDKPYRYKNFKRSSGPETE